MNNLSRRQFLQVAGALTLTHTLQAQEAPDPILDLHQHTPYNNRPRDLVLAHQEQHRVKTTVMLPGEGWMLKIIGGNRECAAFQPNHSDRYVRFASADPAESRAIDVLRGNIQRGAIGIGEMKYHVAVDSPEMHRVYKLAEEMRVPVLLHFEYETYNTGFERFDKVLKAYPKVNFIGHAQTWWGNVSADLDQLDLVGQRLRLPRRKRRRHPERILLGGTIAGPSAKGLVKPGGWTDKLLGDYANLYADLGSRCGVQ